MDYESRLSLSRIQIREISKFARRLLKIKTVKFPVLDALEKLIDKFPKNLYYCILPDDEFETNVMAELVPEGNDVYCIKIRETVYEKAVNGDRETSIVHFHVYKGLDRNPAQRMDEHPHIKEKYAKYLKEYGLYDKC